MKSILNKHRLNNLLRTIQTSIALFEPQGYTDVYFTAQFYRSGKKQNGIERGDLQSFGKQMRTYVVSEEADAARVEFFSERTGKCIYAKALNDLRKNESSDAVTAPPPTAAPMGLGGFAGLGEAQINAMVDRKVDEHRRNDELQRLGRELEEKNRKIEELRDQNLELESRIKARSEIEFYSGIVGTAFPGLASMLKGTPLGQAASFLGGTGEEVEEKAQQERSAEKEGDTQSLAELITEFCMTLNAQELATMQLLFMAFEADKSRIQATLNYITSKAPTQPLAA